MYVVNGWLWKRMQSMRKHWDIQKGLKNNWEVVEISHNWENKFCQTQPLLQAIGEGWEINKWNKALFENTIVGESNVYSDGLISKSWLLLRILSQINPVYTLMSYLFNIYFNSKYCLSVRFPHQNCICISVLPMRPTFPTPTHLFSFIWSSM